MILLFKTLVVAFCLSHLTESIFDKLSDDYKIVKFLKEILGCKSCASFYISLIYSTNLFIACSVWLFMYLYTRFVEPKLTTKL